MRNTRGRYFRAGSSTAKGRRQEKLAVFRDCRQANTSIEWGVGEKLSKLSLKKWARRPSCRTFVAMETRSCKKGQYSQFMFLKML